MRAHPSSVGWAMAANGDEESSVGTRYVLITQCLQNDLFLNRECRLSLPDTAVRTTLLGRRHFDRELGTGSRRKIDAKELKAGPLGLFLEATIGRRRKEAKRENYDHSVLDVINIRDWHVEDDAYDSERRRYGAHCERGTWGAAYVDGLTEYLDPRNAPYTQEAHFFEEGTVRIHHVHADSLFDFRPRSEQIGAEQRKFQKSALEVILDILLMGSDDDIEDMSEKLRADGQPSAIFELACQIDDDENVRCDDRVYVAVIGVYTDLKVTMLLAGLRTRYNLPNLAVSDTFTASATLERHLSGLDFAAKVLGVEVIHGINDLVRYLGGTAELKDESKVVASDSFSRYQSYFQDQQNVLAYETQRLQEYTILTERRARDVYDTVKRANAFLLAWGGAFLTATLALSIASAVDPGGIDWKLPVITGGVSLAQFVGAFFTQPAADMQRNLTNLAAFRMILESHSLKTAFARFHLTTPQLLRELRTEREATAAGLQIDALERELAVIQSLDRADFESLRDLGFRADSAGVDVAAAPAAAAAPVGSVDEATPAPAPAANGDGPG
jgi:hypothetical protein